MNLQIDPIAFHILGFPIRWYAISYILGIIAGVYIAKKVCKILRKFSPDLIEHFINYAVLGIVIGGRLGYVLFYDFEFYMNQPIEILKLWHGGMSFHGGFLGIIIASYIFCKKYSINILDFCDTLSVAAPAGLFFGRIANFINEELYGRPFNGPWAIYQSNTLRHPCQIYEALLEGVLLLLFSSILISKYKISRNRGFLSGIFCIGYSTARNFCEIFRAPDSEFNAALLNNYGITLGQLLSVPMLILGLYLIYNATKKGAET